MLIGCTEQKISKVWTALVKTDNLALLAKLVILYIFLVLENEQFFLLRKWYQ